MKVRFSTPAFRELSEILDHLSAHSSMGARQVAARIRTMAGQLGRQPFSGVETEVPGIRRLTTVPYPYLIFYEVHATEIVIVAIRHGARDPGILPSKRTP